jgi:replicative DNA helicase
MASFLDSSSSLPTGCREIPQAPGPKKGVLALLAMDPTTYMSQAIAFGMTDEFFFLPGHQILWRLFLTRYNANLPLDIISVTQGFSATSASSVFFRSSIRRLSFFYATSP